MMPVSVIGYGQSKAAGDWSKMVADVWLGYRCAGHA